jgi:hypothetical protein
LLAQGAEATGAGKQCENPDSSRNRYDGQPGPNPIRRHGAENPFIGIWNSAGRGLKGDCCRAVACAGEGMRFSGSRGEDGPTPSGRRQRSSAGSTCPPWKEIELGRASRAQQDREGRRP